MSLSKIDVVNNMFNNIAAAPSQNSATAFAPVNIALCKYWGKRDTALNLPLTDSLSVALPNLGAHTQLTVIDAKQDSVALNGKALPADSDFVKKLIAFLELFRQGAPWRLAIDTHSDVSVAAGLASSASGFAALTLALQQLCGWSLSLPQLSILARLGSGSACRSLWSGFVHWQAGQKPDGSDSYGIPLPQSWPDLQLGLLIFHDQPKPISSRAAMQRTVETSTLYQSWPRQVSQDLSDIQTAIGQSDFEKLGIAAERNALAMHATMLAAWPPILYSNAATFAAMQTIWQLRAEGLPVYFTQDAGPHLKLLFLAADKERVQQVFNDLIIVAPFKNA